MYNIYFLFYKFNFFLQMATDFPNDHNANGNEPNMLSIKNIPSRIVTTSSQVKKSKKYYFFMFAIDYWNM